MEKQFFKPIYLASKTAFFTETEHISLLFMKKSLTLLSFLLFGTLLLAQPGNNDCSGIDSLGKAPICNTSIIYTNFNATATDIGNYNLPTTCTGAVAPTHDVWFKFIASDTIDDYRITVTGTGTPALSNAYVMLYRGDCFFDGLAELDCQLPTIGAMETTLDVFGLTHLLTYYIRITDLSPTSTPTWGNFTLCIDEVPPATTIDKGSSNLCNGILYDTGGPDGDYQNDENETFTICPSDPSACITFSFDYFNLENGLTSFVGDQMTFYDGPNVMAPIISTISGPSEPFPPGGGDYAAGGGVCLKVMAKSGCMTINFQSDATEAFEGFAAKWECSAAPCDKLETITVDSSITNADIESFVSAAATQVSITNINCKRGAYGTFLAGDETDLGLKKGLILASGLIENAVGPNQNGGITTSFNGAGDADLDVLSGVGNSESNDACVLELDVFIATDELTFEYVFGSEEYTTFVNSPGGYNDIFAFLISGPGIVGNPAIGNQKNIAVLPNSNTPVEINSVNHLENWQFYRHNNNGQSIEYDGLTSDSLGIKKSLTARQKVTPCQTYHLKLAVADRGDWSLDSGVFISDIKGGAPSLEVAFQSGIDYLIEDCSTTGDNLLVKLDAPSDAAVSYNIEISGTATNGVDYNLAIPSVVTFAAGETVKVFPMSAITDNLQEGTETIIIKMVKNFGCGDISLATITVELKDKIDVEINAGDTAFVCQGGTLVLKADGATTYFWQPPGAVSNSTGNKTSITPTGDIQLTVQGTVGQCVGYDTVLVKVINPTIDLVALADTNICVGGSVPLLVTDNVGGQGLSWSPTAGLSDLGSNPTASPTETTIYTATISIAGCSVSDFLTINVDTLFMPVLVKTDSTICQGYPIQLASGFSTTSTIYQWSPVGAFSDPKIGDPIINPNSNGTYVLTATSANGFCTETKQTKVFVTKAQVQILGDSLNQFCLGTARQVVASVSGGGGIVWSSDPLYPLANPTANPIDVMPDESFWLKATYQVNGCTVFDSIYFRVDSLPNQTITAIESKPIYCPGENVLLTSPTYEPSSFPDLAPDKGNIFWTPSVGAQTPDSLWNFLINTIETTTYSRIIKNGACRDTSSITINVFDPLALNANVDKPAVCAGTQVQLNASGQGIYLVKWTGNGLSNSHIANPTAVVTETTTFTVELDGAPCPSMASVTVVVLPPPALDIKDLILCAANPTTTLQASVDPNGTYKWTGPNGFTSNLGAPTLSPAAPGVYKVTATGIQNGCTQTGEFKIDIADATVSAGADQKLCETEGTGFSVNFTVNGWGGGQTTWSNGQTGASINVAFPINPAQTLTATYIYGNGTCVATDQVILESLPVPNLDLKGQPFDIIVLCAANPVTTLQNSVDLTGTYKWTGPNGFASTLGNPSLSPAASGDYFVTVTSIANGCTRTDQVKVDVANATVSAGPDQKVCYDSLTNSPGGIPLVLTVNGYKTDDSKVTWSNGQTGYEINVPTPVPTALTLVATYVYGANCIAKDSVKIQTVSVPTLTPIAIKTPAPFQGQADYCQYQQIKLKTTVKPAASTLEWSVNGVVATGVKDSILVSAPLLGNNVFKVVATSANGCTDEAEVSVNTIECVKVPNAFTPDGDMLNDVFEVFFPADAGYTVPEMKIWNRWGQLIYDNENTKQQWDGTVNGELAPPEVYIYKLTVLFPDKTEVTYSGDLTLLR